MTKRRTRRDLDATRSHWGAGRAAGYPRCCVLFFVAIFAPLFHLACRLRGTPEQPATGLQEGVRMVTWGVLSAWMAWDRPGHLGMAHRHDCVPCPYHRRFPRRSLDQIPGVGARERL